MWPFGQHALTHATHKIPIWRHLGPLIQKQGLRGTLAHGTVKTRRWAVAMVINICNTFVV
jgi:hypothetical protein